MRSTVLSVRDTVASLRAALVSSSPEDLQAYVPALQEAVALLQQSGEDPLRREDLQVLARELQIATKLIANGLAVSRGLAALLGAGEAGYRPDGEPAALRPGSTILARG